MVAGDGPLEAELTRRIDTERLPVRLLGRRTDVADLLAAADVAVLPSVWEARSLTAQEALRSGTPLVATRVGGVPELVGEAAELVPPGDPVALAERVALPLQAAGGEVLDTVRAVLASGGNLEATARTLFVHPNTVRYRLKRATELTGWSATDPRGGWTLQIALALAELDGSRSLWS